MFWIGRTAENHFQTIKKLNKKPLKNSTFQLKSNNSEMFQKHFLTVIVLPGTLSDSAQITCKFTVCVHICFVDAALGTVTFSFPVSAVVVFVPTCRDGGSSRGRGRGRTSQAQSTRFWTVLLHIGLKIQLPSHTESRLLSLYSALGFVYLGWTHYEYFPSR